jgi:GWxTD domain-containing protein
LIEVSKSSYSFDRSNEIERAVDPSLVLIDPAFQLSIADDSVAYYLASLIPIANQGEVKNILKILRMKNDSLSRKQIQGFWTVTAGANNYEEWIKYKAQIQLVERLYSNSYQAGFETDRGRVYLQYGPPTSLVQRDVSSTEYPYEIWQYNKIVRFSNKRFVFYNPDLVTNGYRLLHSDMVGELKNDRWQYELNKRNTVRGTIDNPNEYLDDSYGSDSYDLFRQY